MKRIENEGYLQFIRRVTDALEAKAITYSEWAQDIIGDTQYGDETLRRCANYFKKFLNRLDEENIKAIKDEEVLQQIKQAKKELEQEKLKVQTENLEYNRNQRLEARNQLFNEKIEQAINRLEPIEVKHIKKTLPTETTGLLILADQHFDSTFEVKGLWGEVVNKYDKEIFKTRMWYLLGQMENERFDYDRLVIVSQGDALEGILRMTSLQKLRQPVIDSAIEFAEFMAQWLVEAQRRLAVPITFELISGNHDIIRNLQQKPEFPEETLAKVIHEFIRLRLKDVEDITIEPYADVYYTTIHGSNLMFAHGEYGDLVNLMEYYENLYSVEIDCLYGAHLHSTDVKAVGVANLGDRECIRVPSIMGTDPFAKKIRKHSRAGAYFALYSDSGRELSKIYYLN